MRDLTEEERARMQEFLIRNHHKILHAQRFALFSVAISLAALALVVFRAVYL